MEYLNVNFHPQYGADNYVRNILPHFVYGDHLEVRKKIQTIDLNCIDKSSLLYLIDKFPACISRAQIQSLDVKKKNDLNDRELNTFLKHFGDYLTEKQQMSRRVYFEDTPLDRPVGSNNTNFANHDEVKGKIKTGVTRIIQQKPKHPCKKTDKGVF